MLICFRQLHIYLADDLLLGRTAGCRLYLHVPLLWKKYGGDLYTVETGKRTLLLIHIWREKSVKSTKYFCMWILLVVELVLNDKMDSTIKKGRVKLV